MWFQLYQESALYEKSYNKLVDAQKQFLLCGVQMLAGDIEGGPGWHAAVFRRPLFAIDIEGPEWAQTYLWLENALVRARAYPHEIIDFNEID